MSEASTAGYQQSDADRDEQYGVVNGHNTRCSSLLGQGCDCRSPWPDDDRIVRYAQRFFWLAIVFFVVVGLLALPIW